MGTTLSRPTLSILPYLALQSAVILGKSPPPIGYYVNDGPVNVGTIPYVNMNVTSAGEPPNVEFSIGEFREKGVLTQVKRARRVGLEVKGQDDIQGYHLELCRTFDSVDSSDRWTDGRVRYNVGEKQRSKVRICPVNGKWVAFFCVELRNRNIVKLKCPVVLKRSEDSLEASTPRNDEGVHHSVESRQGATPSIVDVSTSIQPIMSDKKDLTTHGRPPPTGNYNGELKVVDGDEVNVLNIFITISKDASGGLIAKLSLYAAHRTAAVSDLEVPLLYRENDCWVFDLKSMRGTEQVKEDVLYAMRDITGVDSLDWDSMLMCYRETEWHMYLGNTPLVDVALHRRQPLKRKTDE